MMDQYNRGTYSFAGGWSILVLGSPSATESLAPNYEEVRLCQALWTLRTNDVLDIKPAIYSELNVRFARHY